MSSMVLEKYKYHHVGCYKCPLLYQSICYPTVNEDVRKLTMPPLHGHQAIYLAGDQFLLKSDWLGIRQWATKIIVHKKWHELQEFFNLIQKESSNTLQISHDLKYKKTPTIKEVNSLFEAVHYMEHPWWATLPIGEAFEEAVTQATKQYVLSEDQVYIFFNIAKPTFMLQQQISSDKLGNRIRRTGINMNRKIKQVLDDIKQLQPELFEDMRKHVDEYEWFGMMHFWGTPFTLEKLMDQILHQKQKINKTNEQVLLPEDLEKLKNMATELSYWRQYCADVCAVASLTARMALGSISQKTMDLSYDDALWLTADEFLQGMSKKRKFDISMLRERQNRYGLLYEDEIERVITGQMVLDLADQLLDPVFDVSEIQGTTANKGNVRGQVRIIMTPSDIVKVKIRDIIVSHETTPDFVPALSKASAIVTDIGGISSHAAIVSRELNLPCIIGTKIATQILKDGDMVEVDADNGVVKILS